MCSENYFISCDWGTSNFRLRVVDRDSLEVLAARTSILGTKAVHQQFLAQDQKSQEEVFSAYLLEQIQTLPKGFQHLPMVVSGMASSTIGMKELQYAGFPFDGSGEQLYWEKMSLDSGLEFILVSGVKSHTGIMRGEEIQAVGLSTHLRVYGSAILVLPGTHSKHIRYLDGAYTHLTNFMTGELFEVLTTHSILSNSVSEGPWDQCAREAFSLGLQQGTLGSLTSHLLTVRTQDVLEHTPKDSNYFFLSGLLIGDELRYLKHQQDTICLAASGPLFTLYKYALELLCPSDQLAFLDAGALEKALFAGQHKILVHNEK